MTAMALRCEGKAVVGWAAIDDGGLEMAGDEKGKQGIQTRAWRHRIAFYKLSYWSAHENMFQGQWQHFYSFLFP